MGDTVDEAMQSGDEMGLWQVWDAHSSRRIWHEVIRKGGDANVAQGALRGLPDVTALEALEANRRLVDLLTGRRWSAMRDAREAGASWSEIGAALGMTKQGAQDWYRRKIADQEKYVGDLHDSPRARAVLALDKSTDVTGSSGE